MKELMLSDLNAIRGIPFHLECRLGKTFIVGSQ